MRKTLLLCLSLATPAFAQGMQGMDNMPGMDMPATQS